MGAGLPAAVITLVALAAAASLDAMADGPALAPGIGNGNETTLP